MIKGNLTYLGIHITVANYPKTAIKSLIICNLKMN